MGLMANSFSKNQCQAQECALCVSVKGPHGDTASEPHVSRKVIRESSVNGPKAA